jgi:hypothetical protein
LSKRLQLINSFGATHYSNGAIEMPNLGVNLFSYRIGLQCKLNPEEREKITMEVPEVYGKSALTIVVGAGVKEKRPLGGEKFTVASGSVDYMKVFSLKHKFGAGIDVFYDETLFELQNPDSTLNLTNQDIIRYGIHLSAEAQYKKLVLAVHIGTYLHANYTDDGKNLSKSSIEIFAHKKICLQIFL